MVALLVQSIPATTRAQPKPQPSQPLRLKAFANLPLLPHGVIYGPHTMRSVMATVYYRDSRRVSTTALTKLLRSAGWTVVKQRTGEADDDPVNPATYRQLWVRKHSIRVRLALVDREERGGTIVFVMRDK